MSEPVFSVSQAVAVINQTLDAVYQTMTVVGELSQFKIAKERWVYADIKDDTAKLRLFGTVYQLPAPLEDGMLVEVVAEPRLHPQFGFSLNIVSIRPVGEGSIKKAANLLQAKLEKEGLFAPERKRPVPHGPERIGLVASEESAAYGDFIKILNARWQGVEVQLYNVTVQGESAPESIIQAIQYFSQTSDAPEVVVVIRGGGSADDLAAFSTEQVTRAIAASRVPTVVAVGHETDVSLAELAADMRASTPSNAAELLFPDKHEVKQQLKLRSSSLEQSVLAELEVRQSKLDSAADTMRQHVLQHIDQKSHGLRQAETLLESVHPQATLRRGYAIIEKAGRLVSSTKQLKKNDTVEITLRDGAAKADITHVE